MEERSLVVHESERVVVQTIFELHNRWRGWSLRRIAANLNGAGFTTSTGKPFSAMAVKRVLDRREFYTGQYRYADVVSEGLYTPIL